MDTLRQDLRFTFRTLARNPRVIIILLFTLALGIGATTAIFSIVNAVLLKPLPFRNPNRLVSVWLKNPAQNYKQFYVSAPDFVDFRDQNRVFETASAFSLTSFTLTGRGDPVEVTGAVVSGGFFPMLGIRPLLGRTLLSGDATPGHDHVAVLSYALWQQRFGADPRVVGGTVVLNGSDYTIAGVLPPGAEFPPYFDLTGGMIPWKLGVWVPLDLSTRYFGTFDLSNRGADSFIVLARLKPGVDLQSAQSDLDTISARIQVEYPETSKGWGVIVVPLSEQMVGSVRSALLVLLGAVGFVLLIACANAAGLLLARAAARQNEIAIRIALGAGRGRIVRQLLTESAVMGILGGVLGLALAYAGTSLLAAMVPLTIPRGGEAHIDLSVLCFALGISILTGLLFGLTPALQTSKIDVNIALTEGGRSGTGSLRSQRVRTVLVVGEIALALVLAVGAGLMIKSFLRLQSVNPGFEPHDLLTFQVRFGRRRYPEERQRADFNRQLLESVRKLPGVQSAGAIDRLPLSGGTGSWTFAIEGRPPVPSAERPLAYYHAISPGYFRTMGIPLLRGRDFDEQDARDDPKVAIINETLARRFFPNEDPIGERINLVDAPAAPVWREIIGVAGDVRYDNLDVQPAPSIYALDLQSYPDFPTDQIAIVMRTNLATGSMASAVRREVRDIDKDQAVTNLRTMDDYLSESVAKPRLFLVVFDFFSFLALALAAVGLYGVISYTVSQRSREIGIRMALGAQRGDVVWLVLSRAIQMALIGIGLGLAASLVLTRAIASFLYGVSRLDAMVFVTVPIVLGAAVLAASYLPARRASRVDPMAGLRHE